MDKTVLALSILVLHYLKTSESAPAAQGNSEYQLLFASPLFGSPGGGDPFDDGVTAVVPRAVRIASLALCSGDAVDGI